MGEKITVVIASIVIIILIPYVITLSMNGRFRDGDAWLSNVDTGMDVLIKQNGSNILMDVEEYIVGVCFLATIIFDTNVRISSTI